MRIVQQPTIHSLLPQALWPLDMREARSPEVVAPHEQCESDVREGSGMLPDGARYWVLPEDVERIVVSQRVGSQPWWVNRSASIRFAGPASPNDRPLPGTLLVEVGMPVVAIGAVDGEP